MNQKIKNLIISAMALTASLSAMTVSAAAAVQADTSVESAETSESVTFEADGVNYTVLDGVNASVAGLAVNSSVVEIPEKVVYNDAEYTVAAIDERAFAYKSVRYIKLPSTVTAIGNLAFYYSSIEEIAIPENTASIGDGAFSYCSALDTIAVPDGVESIGERAFSMCDNLTSVSIPASVELLGKEAFYSCKALETIVYSSDQESWSTLSAEANVPEGVIVVYNYTEPKIYNTSGLVLGQKLNAGDTLNYDDENGIGMIANIVNTNGSFDLVSLVGVSEYVLPWNAELVGIDGVTIYLAPEYDEINYVDVRTLSVGDVIDKDTYLLCYDYVTNGRVSPVFLPSYYKTYIGEGTIKVKSIDAENKQVTLEAVQDEAVISGDANGDGEVNIADAVILQKYLLCADSSQSMDCGCADLNSDSFVDAFDMVLLRKQLLPQ
ncbi:MAG: leucine-rich repeat protein [Ruminococcus sp.]|nr:leucine-rich repeat protein [Ruminococcus sp.]